MVLYLDSDFFFMAVLKERYMKKIVIIGANDFQNPLILKAKEMGFETHVFAWKDGSVGERTADFFTPSVLWSGIES